MELQTAYSTRRRSWCNIFAIWRAVESYLRLLRSRAATSSAARRSRFERKSKLSGSVTSLVSQAFAKFSQPFQPSDRMKALRHIGAIRYSDETNPGL